MGAGFNSMRKHFHINGRKSRITDAQENEIRRAFFKDNTPASTLMTQYGISESMMRRVVGGPLTNKFAGIETIWGGD